MRVWWEVAVCRLNRNYTFLACQWVKQRQLGCEASEISLATFSSLEILSNPEDFLAVAKAVGEHTAVGAKERPYKVSIRCSFKVSSP